MKAREVPVGCVIVRDGHVIARGYNLTNATRNVRGTTETWGHNRIHILHVSTD